MLERQARYIGKQSGPCNFKIRVLGEDESVLDSTGQKSSSGTLTDDDYIGEFLSNFRAVASASLGGPIFVERGQDEHYHVWSDVKGMETIKRVMEDAGFTEEKTP